MDLFSKKIVALELDINPMATALYAKLGANAGCASPLSLIGILAKELSEPLGYTGFSAHLFFSTLMSGLVFTLVVYVLYKGYKVKADNLLKLSQIPKFNRKQQVTMAATSGILSWVNSTMAALGIFSLGGVF